MKDSDHAERPWLASYDPGVPPNLDYERITVVEALKKAATLFPDQEAVSCQGFTLSWAELNDLVDRLATAFAGFGLAKGDRAALLLPNGIPAVASFFAILSIGAVAVPGNPDFSDRELSHLLNDSASRMVVCLDLLANRLIDLRPLTSVRQVVAAGLGDFLPFPRSLLFPILARKKGLTAEVKKAPDVFRLKDLIGRNQPAPPAVGLSWPDPACFCYTGGTTGTAKGVVLSHRNLAANAQQLAAWFPFLEKGKGAVLGALPLFTAFGITACLNLPVWTAARMALVPGSSAEDLARAMAKQKPCLAPLSPTRLAGLLARSDWEGQDFASTRAVLCGSSALAPSLASEWEARADVPVLEVYGLTEAGPLVCANPASGNPKPGSVGLPLPDTECRLVDIAIGESPAAPGEPGELIVRGPQVMSGYWNKQEDTAEALRDGWLFTGDIARMDEDGYLFLTDRKKDLIVCGGLNVYPREVEEVLCTHPKIVEACAVGIPHPIRGEAVKVFAVTAPGETAGEDEIILFLKDLLAPHKLPVEIEFRENLPKSNVGKILKKDLKEQEMGRGR